MSSLIGVTRLALAEALAAAASCPAPEQPTARNRGEIRAPAFST